MKNIIIIYILSSPWPLLTIFKEILFKEKINANILIGGNEISRIYCMFDPKTYRFVQVMAKHNNNNFNSCFSEKTGKILTHNQLSISPMEVDHNQNYYAINYEQKNGEIFISNNIEMEKDIDDIVINKSESILKVSSNLVSKEEIKIIEKSLNKFKDYNEKIIYPKKTAGYVINNLTTSSKDGAKFFYKSINKDLYWYNKKGMIMVNRNDKDYIRSIAYLIEGVENNKGLQKYKINEKNQQIVSEQILKGIGGYENIKWMENVWTKEQMLKITVCMWIYLQNQNKEKW